MVAVPPLTGLSASGKNGVSSSGKNGLNASGASANLKPQAVMTDEVAAILNGLNLDKVFFQSKIRIEPVQELEPKFPHEDNCLSPTSGGGPDSPVLRQRKGGRATTRTQVLSMQKAKPKGSAKTADFDIYLNEAVMPVLAQALDSLTRQLNRMDKQGDRLDPKVRERFNPLTWVAQQLLRSHPKVARTPRRQAIYKNFKDWGDWEKGRREMLRSRDDIHKIFAEFMLSNNKGCVQKDTITNVLHGIDSEMKLQGLLQGNEEMMKALDFEDERPVTGSKSVQASPSKAPANTPSPRMSATPSFGTLSDPLRKIKSKPAWFKGGVSFEVFWYTFAQVIMAHDVVPYSLIVRGRKLREEHDREHKEWEEAQLKEAEQRSAKDAQRQKEIAEYSEIYHVIVEEPSIRLILDENKILTGDDVRPTDAGYEFEVPPKGRHCNLLAQLFGVLGFTLRPSSSAEGAGLGAPPAEGEHDERWWDEELANAWKTIQAALSAELIDGVVEREILAKVLVAPVNAPNVKSIIADEFDRQLEGEAGEERRRQKSIDDDDHGEEQTKSKKPSMETLCQLYKMTMARIGWLHQLFESYLQVHSDSESESDEETSEKQSKKIRDHYPRHPASITKEKMKMLVGEVNPDMDEDEFEARFRRIDSDGGGAIEFDEFVGWIYSDDIAVVGSSNRKMPIEELSTTHGESVALLEYLHTCYKEQLPEGTTDNYPDDPAPLSKNEAWDLIQIVAPGTDVEAFERPWKIVDVEEKGQVDFDEWLEVLDFDSLPEATRKGYP